MTIQATYAIANLTALTALTSPERVDGYSRLVKSDAEGNQNWFTFIAGSSAVANSDTILIPNDNPTTGRWFKHTGVLPVLVAGTVTTLSAGSAATASVSAVPEQPNTYQINLGIPQGAAGSSGGWIYKNADYTAVAGDRIIADTTTPWSLTLPPSPTVEQEIEIVKSQSGTLTIVPQSANINSKSPQAYSFAYTNTQELLHLIFIDTNIGWLSAPNAIISTVVGSDPSVIFGNSLIAWYRADTVTADSNNNVNQWTDKSGRGNHAAQSNSGLQPLLNSTGFNGKSVLQMQGSKWLSMPNCLSASWGSASLFVLYNLSDRTNQTTVMFTGADNNGEYWSSNSQFNYVSYFGEFRNNRLNAQPTDLGDLGQKLVTIVSDGPNNLYSIYKNGNSSYSTTPDFGVTSTPYIGRDHNNSQFLAGDIAEIILVNRAATDSERSQVRAYLKAFWNLTIY